MPNMTQSGGSGPANLKPDRDYARVRASLRTEFPDKMWDETRLCYAPARQARSSFQEEVVGARFAKGAPLFVDGLGLWAGEDFLEAR